MFLFKLLFRFTLWTCFLCSVVLCYSQALEASEAFEMEWSDWVKQRQPTLDCPKSFIPKLKPVCVWPGQLKLQLDAKGMSFSLPVEVFREQALLTIPGSTKHWPTAVWVNEQSTAISESSAKPHLLLSKGKHHIRGRFDWQQRPRSIAVPSMFAYLSLTQNGENKPVNHHAGNVFFEKKTLQKHEKHFMC